MRWIRPRLLAAMASVSGALLVAALVAASPGGVGERLGAAVGGPGGGGRPGARSVSAHRSPLQLAQPIVAVAGTDHGRGSWLAAADGGVFTQGTASFYGSVGGQRLAAPIVGISATADGRGYWLVASDGGIFTFGDARFFGSTGAIRLNQPIVGMASTPDGRGYWLAASDGGIFSFGDARFFGSTGAIRLNQPIVGMASTPDGRGYWLAASDGGIFTFGDARFSGAAAGSVPAGSVVGVVGDAAGGYQLATVLGQVVGFGGAASAAAMVQATSVAQAASAAGGPYSFMLLGVGGAPARYDPCQTLHYVVNLAEAPPGALGVVQAAVAQVSAATGIAFSYDGTTSELPSSRRAVFQPLVYGLRWAPILVAWEHPGQTDFLQAGSQEAGSAGSDELLGPIVPEYLMGQLAMDADLSLPNTSASGPSWLKVTLHELGHVMGLGHVSDTSQVMYPVITAQTPESYGSGDRAGLAQLGVRAGCLVLPTPSPVNLS